MSHHPVIKKEVYELLVEGSFEPLTSGASFHMNVFVVPKCTGGLQPILNL